MRPHQSTTVVISGHGGTVREFSRFFGGCSSLQYSNGSRRSLAGVRQGAVTTKSRCSVRSSVTPEQPGRIGRCLPRLSLAIRWRRVTLKAHRNAGATSCRLVRRLGAFSAVLNNDGVAIADRHRRRHDIRPDAAVTVRQSGTELATLRSDRLRQAVPTPAH